MKKFTIIFFAAIVVLFVGMLTYVGGTKNFSAPKAGNAAHIAQKDDLNAPVWKKKMKDLVKYLSDKGLIDSSKKQELATSGFCSEALNYDGAEIYWWDVDKLPKTGDEYKAFESLRKNGNIDLWGSGSIISPTRNGPFALLTTKYKGNAKKLLKAFGQFGK